MGSFVGTLTVDLDAVAANWLQLKSYVGPAECGAVVKANAYGLGVSQVSRVLYRSGCRTFFVANIQEAIELKCILSADDIRVFVLSGCASGDELLFVEQGVSPVIISMEMLQRWSAVCRQSSNTLLPEAALKINTGMTRLGLDLDELEALLASSDESQALLEGGNIRVLLSHFACADEVGHELNTVQIAQFAKAVEILKKRIPDLRASLANSSGIYLAQKPHWDIVRPGVSLYGGNPIPGKANPMRSVVNLSLPVLQVRYAPKGANIGYGATAILSSDRVLAVVAGGYADGLFRSLSNKAVGVMYVQGLPVRVPLVGRVSMDSSIFDVTEVANQASVAVGDSIEILGKQHGVDDLAESANTISYEVLTSLGARYKRTYLSEGGDV
ncbi:alanine racemase [Teredinibacter sp. KSP-S5-2]|uniref:alanine racemase n=1 Tax=Teredinibacter sp. KSP-S5-2 TaxID=3034506 RepID=UPI002934CCED|nr:alanine racemase [Teredinibacter sp. KSP-S5-2]WNO09685.1 alanine racemase [Teredinibacter sp. KSP-S5-2]